MPRPPETTMPFADLNNMPKRQMLPGIKARFVHGENMTISYWDLDTGATIPPHSHPHEQVTSLISGEMEMSVGGDTRLIGPGSGLVEAVSPAQAVQDLHPVPD